MLEKMMSKVESVSAGALHEVLEFATVTEKTHANLIEFVSLMRSRVPSVKTFIENWLSETVRAHGEIMERRGALPPPPKGFEQECRIENVLIEISNWKCLEYMLRMALDPGTLNVLGSMRASIGTVPNGMSLLTCDQPVVLYHPAARLGDAHGPADPDIEISVPLSSQTLLLLTWGKELPVGGMLQVDEVEEYNRRTVIMADSFVFAVPRHVKSALETVNRYRSYHAGSELKVLKSEHGAFFINLRFNPVLAPKNYC